MFSRPVGNEQPTTCDILQHALTELGIDIDISTLDGFEALVSYIETNRNRLDLGDLTPLYHLVNATSPYYREIDIERFRPLFTRLGESVYLVSEL